MNIKNLRFIVENVAAIRGQITENGPESDNMNNVFPWRLEL